MTADKRWEDTAAEIARKIAAYEPGLDPPPSSRIMAALHNEYAEGRKSGLADAGAAAGREAELRARIVQAVESGNSEYWEKSRAAEERWRNSQEGAPVDGAGTIIDCIARSVIAAILDAPAPNAASEDQPWGVVIVQQRREIEALKAELAAADKCLRELAAPSAASGTEKRDD